MVAAFKNILLISNFESSPVQFAFYGGYCVMAFPAALFMKRFREACGPNRFRQAQFSARSNVGHDGSVFRNHSGL